MKTNKLILSAGLLALAMSSCTDLDVAVESQYTEDPSVNSGIDPMILVEAKMSDVYFHLAGTLGRRYMEAQCLASDEFTALAFDGGYYDAGTYAHTAYHNFHYEDASTDWYADVTSGISKVNAVLEDLGAGASVKMTAPARAIRAYFTWILMDSYGDAPIIEKVPAEGEIIERSPRADVALWLESELTEIIPKLTTEMNANNYGKPTRWMAEALLVKLYINWPVYTVDAVENYDAANAKNDRLDKCIEYCNDIINSGMFDLGTVDYLHKFSYDNTDAVLAGKNNDFIYAVPYHATDLAGMQYARPRSYKNTKKQFPNMYGFGDDNLFTQSFGGNIVVTPECVSLFSLEGDIRNLSILGGEVYARDPMTLRPTDTRVLDGGVELTFTKDIALVKDDGTLDVGNDVVAYQQGYHSIKWFTCPGDYNNGRNQGNDLPIFRYADILLTKAEALVRQGNGGAMELFNQIRTYAGAPTISAEPTLKDLLDERGREFFDENWRRNDMIRFGTFEGEFFPHYSSSPFANFDKTRRIFPVCKSVLQLNPTWKQNNGYTGMDATE